MNSINTRGFGLLEVLTALTVLSVGVLGVVALQLHTARISQDTHYRTIALQLASDVAEHLGQPSGTRHAASWDSASHSDSEPPAADCFGSRAHCGIDEMAAFERQGWLQRLHAGLPGARLRVCHDRQPWDTLAMQPRWACDDDLNAAIWIKIGWQDQAAPSVHAAAPPRLLLPIGAL